MGFNYWSWLATDWLLNTVEPSKILTFGRQVIHVHPWDRECPILNAQEHGNPHQFLNDDPTINNYADESYFPSKKVEALSLDYSDYENADLIADLTTDLSSDKTLLRHLNTFDIVFDIGTSEHVGNPFQSLLNAFDLVKPGGFYVYDLPYENWNNHGFFQFTPTFFSDLTRTNNYDLIFQFAHPTAKGNQPLMFVRDSITYNAKVYTSLFGVIQKSHSQSRLKPPYQSEQLLSNSFNLSDYSTDKNYPLCNPVKPEGFFDYLNCSTANDLYYLGFDANRNCGSYNIYNPSRTLTKDKQEIQSSEVQIFN